MASKSRPAAAPEPEFFPDFTPVPRAQREDGWTPDKQVAFITALAECGCIAEACKAVGMARVSAYRLRADPHAAGFRAAWENALDYAVRRIADNAFSRALHGVSWPIFYHGEQIGERIRHDERLVMFLLRTRDPLRYAPPSGVQLTVDPCELPARRLRDSLADLEDQAFEAAYRLEAERAECGGTAAAGDPAEGDFERDVV
ncbi:hypothetical protein [Sphingomonas sp. PB4P5]|uniref:hypothetical protein n=1 Tax=Parasphingomonas puruogangriensis TaxID=3096155 RepID=UPI002FC5BDB4